MRNTVLASFAMPRLPESPRARRRLAWSAGAGALLVIGLAVALLIPNKQAPNPVPTGKAEPAQLAVNTKTKLTRVDRRAIDTLLDRFIPAGVAQKDPETAWRLSAGEMKSGSTLAQWKKGTSPIPYYPVKERNFHHWQPVDVEKGAVILDILVHPTDPTKLGTWVFSMQVVKQHSRWLVNRIYTIAVMNPPTRPRTVTHELGPADYAAPPASSSTKSTATTHHLGLLPVLLIFALILLIPLTLGVLAFLRHRRWRRTVRESGRTELPPLPSAYRQQREEEQEVASRS